jgi:hypothetical protein
MIKKYGWLGFHMILLKANAQIFYKKCSWCEKKLLSNTPIHFFLLEKPSVELTKSETRQAVLNKKKQTQN